jgi:hypothetical protein
MRGAPGKQTQRTLFATQRFCDETAAGLQRVEREDGAGLVACRTQLGRIPRRREELVERVNEWRGGCERQNIADGFCDETPG